MAATNRSGKKPLNILDKKVPENPKYKNVKCTIDTGASLTRQIKKIEEIRKNYKYKKDEIFKRMKPTTFAQLVLQVAQVASLEQDRTDLESSSGRDSIVSEASTLIPDPDEKLPSETPVPPLDLAENRSNTSGSESSRSTLHGLISGVGEMDVRDDENIETPQTPVNQEIQAPSVESMPYLLLDVRDKEAFDRCHIIGATNYPIAMLSRAFNYFTKEIVMFRNRLGKIIIIYDEDERLASAAATTFVEREVDNVFMLSGGLKVLAKKFSEGLITGPIPSSCLPTPPPTRRSAGKPSTRKPASPVIDEPIKHVEFFTPEHLEMLQDKLDSDLLSQESSSRMSSRLSARSGMSTASTVSNASTLSSASKSKPWK